MPILGEIVPGARRWVAVPGMTPDRSVRRRAARHSRRDAAPRRRARGRARGLPPRRRHRPRSRAWAWTSAVVPDLDRDEPRGEARCAACTTRLPRTRSPRRSGARTARSSTSLVDLRPDEPTYGHWLSVHLAGGRADRPPHPARDRTRLPDARGRHVADVRHQRAVRPRERSQPALGRPDGGHRVAAAGHRHLEARPRGAAMASVALITGASGLIGAARPAAVERRGDCARTRSTTRATICWCQACRRRSWSACEPAVVVHLAWAASGTPGYRDSPDNEALGARHRSSSQRPAAPPGPACVATGTSLDTAPVAGDAYSRAKVRLWQRAAARDREPARVTWLRPYYVIDPERRRPALVDTRAGRARGGDARRAADARRATTTSSTPRTSGAPWWSPWSIASTVSCRSDPDGCGGCATSSRRSASGGSRPPIRSIRPARSSTTSPTPAGYESSAGRRPTPRSCSRASDAPSIWRFSSRVRQRRVASTTA